MTSVLAGSAAYGQVFPTKPVRIVTSEPGGGGDIIARVLAQGMARSLGQQVIVDNRSGALPGEIVAKAPADGYTLLLHGGSFYLAPFMQKLGYDVQKDFTSITQAIHSPNVIVIHPSVAATSIRELIALAKARPGQLNYGSGATGVPTHLSAELFKSMAGVDIVRIPYKGTGPALTGLISGENQIMFATASAVAAHIKSGKLKALAVTSLEPSALTPDLPTVAATLPGYESESIIGVFAPARTPPATIRRLNQEAVRVLHQPDVKERLFHAGTEAVGNSPEQFAAVIKREISKWGKVIKDAGIKPD
jgi:tripartite-type tricarboxylate transporter receptor subunit TctC